MFLLRRYSPYNLTLGACSVSHIRIFFYLNRDLLQKRIRKEAKKRLRLESYESNRNVFICAPDTQAVPHMHMSNTMADAQKVNCLIVFALRTQWNVMFGRFADGVGKQCDVTHTLH